GRRVQDRDALRGPLATGRRGAGARDRAGCDRLRARICEVARDDGPSDRAAPADPGEARRHGDGVRGCARSLVPLRPDGRRRRRRRGADEVVRDGGAEVRGRRAGGDDRRPADPRRLRLNHGVPRRALYARCEDHTDLRRHAGDPATRDRARDAEGVPRLPALGRRLMEEIRPGLWTWTGEHPEWTPEFVWGPEVRSYAVQLEDLRVLIDPVLPAPRADAVL